MQFFETIFMDINTLIGAVSQGLLWSILALGVYITYRILDYADLTTEGSFPMGAAIAAKCILDGINPFLSTLLAAAGGMLAGFVTGMLHTKLKIPALLSGILTMTGLYSINLRIMGKANLPLLKQPTILSIASDTFHLSTKDTVLLVGILGAVLVIVCLWLLFRTEFGFALRATGDNPAMISALGVNTNKMKILGLMLGNALIALAGGLIGQYNGYSDVGMGTGTIVIGLASVIMGEVLFGKNCILRSLISVVCGSVLYRIIIAFVLGKGLQPTDLKLFSALLLAVCLFLPSIKTWIQKQIAIRRKGIGDASDVKN